MIGGGLEAKVEAREGMKAEGTVIIIKRFAPVVAMGMETVRR